MDLQQNNPTLAELEGHDSWSYKADLLGFSLRSFHGHRVWVLPPVCVLGSGETPFTWTSSVLLFTLPSCPDSASGSLPAHKAPPNHILASGVPCQLLPHLVPKLSEGQNWWGGWWVIRCWYCGRERKIAFFYVWCLGEDPTTSLDLSE